MTSETKLLSEPPRGGKNEAPASDRQHDYIRDLLARKPAAAEGILETMLGKPRSAWTNGEANFAINQLKNHPSMQDSVPSTAHNEAWRRSPLTEPEPPLELIRVTCTRLGIAPGDLRVAGVGEIIRAAWPDIRTYAPADSAAIDAATAALTVDATSKGLCRDCNAEIYWAKNEYGTSVPLTLEGPSHIVVSGVVRSVQTYAYHSSACSKKPKISDTAKVAKDEAPAEDVFGLGIEHPTVLF